MATIFLLFPLLLTLTLHLHAVSATVLHLSSAVPPKSPSVSIVLKVGGIRKLPITLAPGQEGTFAITVNDAYFANAIYGHKFTPFPAYDPARDEGKADVYWRATDRGLEISYDKAAWKLEAPWDTE